MPGNLMSPDEKQIMDTDGIKQALVELNFAVSEVAAMTTQTHDQMGLVISRVDVVEEDFSGLSRKVDREISESKRQANEIRSEIKKMRKETLSQTDFTKFMNRILWKVVGLLVAGLSVFGTLMVNKVFH